MGSINASLVAYKVSEAIGKPEIVNLGKIMRETGYSLSTSKTPKRATSTKSFKIVMKSLVQQLDEEIQRIQKELKKKDLSEVQYESLVRSMDIQIKNKQLLSGGVTERSVLVLPNEVIDKYNIKNGTQ